MSLHPLKKQVFSHMSFFLKPPCANNGWRYQMLSLAPSRKRKQQRFPQGHASQCIGLPSPEFGRGCWRTHIYTQPVFLKNSFDNVKLWKIVALNHLRIESLPCYSRSWRALFSRLWRWRFKGALTLEVFHEYFIRIRTIIFGSPKITHTHRA